MGEVGEERKMEIRICVLMQVGGDSPRVHSLARVVDFPPRYKFYRGLGLSNIAIFILSPYCLQTFPTLTSALQCHRRAPSGRVNPLGEC